MKKFLIPMIAAVFALTGCTSSPTSEEASVPTEEVVSSTQEASESTSGTVDDVYELRAEYEKALGAKCEYWRMTDKTLWPNRLWDEKASCDSGHLTVYPSQQHRDKDVDTVIEEHQRDDVKQPLLIGENWVVYLGPDFDDQTMSAMAEAMGAEFIWTNNFDDINEPTDPAELIEAFGAEIDCDITIPPGSVGGLSDDEAQAGFCNLEDPSLDPANSGLWVFAGATFSIADSLTEIVEVGEGRYLLTRGQLVLIAPDLDYALEFSELYGFGIEFKL